MPYKRTTNAPGCPEYQSWTSMWQRCVNPKSGAYQNYGGRGIRVARRWRDFFKFVEDMGRRPKGTTLGRLDNDGDYRPGNVAWHTAIEQVDNRRCTVHVEVNGQRRALAYWCRQYRVDRDIVRNRFRKHGDWQRAFEEAKRNLNSEAVIWVTINGKRKRARDWCKIYGIRFQKAWSRVNRDGWTWKRAITTPTLHQRDRKIGKAITIKGKTQSIHQWCLDLGIPNGTYWKRTKIQGMTPRQALLCKKRINQYK